MLNGFLHVFFVVMICWSLIQTLTTDPGYITTDILQQLGLREDETQQDPEMTVWRLNKKHYDRNMLLDRDDH